MAGAGIVNPFVCNVNSSVPCVMCVHTRLRSWEVVKAWEFYGWIYETAMREVGVREVGGWKRIEPCPEMVR